jgi:hypothetical protein
VTAHFGDCGGSSVEIGTDEITPLLGIELRGDRRRTDQIERRSPIAPAASIGGG